MSISGVSSGTTASYTTNTQQNDVRNAFKQVADAINNNDVDGAQNAFDNLAALLNGDQSSSTSNSTSSSSSSQSSTSGTDLASLLNQVGSALQSGDLDQAKQALQNLQQSGQASGKHRHHHGGGGGGASAVAGIPPAQGTGSTSVSTDLSTSGLDLTV
jgi:ribosomal protein S20